MAFRRTARKREDTMTASTTTGTLAGLRGCGGRHSTYLTATSAATGEFQLVLVRADEVAPSETAATAAAETASTAALALATLRICVAVDTTSTRTGGGRRCSSCGSCNSLDSLHRGVGIGLPGVRTVALGIGREGRLALLLGHP